MAASTASFLMPFVTEHLPKLATERKYLMVCVSQRDWLTKTEKHCLTPRITRSDLLTISAIRATILWRLTTSVQLHL